MIANARHKMWAKSGIRASREGTIVTAVHLQIYRVGRNVRVRQITGSFFKLAILCACVYAVTKWQEGEIQGDDVKAFAENACEDEVRSRFDVSRVSIYDLKANSNGYTVRASATLSRGTPVKIVCLANPQGGIRDVTVDER